MAHLPRLRNTTWRRALLFAGWALWLTAPLLLFGEQGYVRIPDNADSNLAVRLAWQTLSAGERLGAWNPFGGCGNDAVITGLFPTDLEHLFFLVFPGWLGYGLFSWLQRFLAGFFTYLLCLRVLHLRRPVALLAGLGYALFSQPWLDRSWDGFTLYDRLGLPGLPLALYALSRLPRLPIGKAVLLGAGIGLFMGVGSHYAFGLFLALAIVLFFTCITPTGHRHLWLGMAAMFGVWGLVELPVLLAALRHAGESHRAGVDYRHPFFREMANYPSLVWRSAYTNLPPLLLGAVGIAMRRGRARLTTALMAIVLAIGVYLLGFDALQMALGDHLGLLRGFRLERVYLLLPFLILLAGVAGLAVIRKRRPVLGRGLTAVLLLAVVVQSAAVLFSMHRARTQGNNFQALYRQRALQMLAERLREEGPYRAAVVGALPGGRGLHPAYLWTYGIETADGYTTLYPQRYHAYWQAVLAPLFAQDPAREQYFEHWGNAVYLFPPPHAAAFAETYNLDLLSLANVRYLVSDDALDDARLRLLMVDQEDRRGFRYIYENPSALPRVFIPARVKFCTDTDALLQALRSMSSAELASTLLVEAADAPVELPAIGDEQAIVQDIQCDTRGVRFRLTARRPTAFAVSIPYMRGWRAHAGEREIPLFPAYHAFTAGVAPAGSTEIVLEYLR